MIKELTVQECDANEAARCIYRRLKKNKNAKQFLIQLIERLNILCSVQTS
jgi:hypothetical protein